MMTWSDVIVTYVTAVVAIIVSLAAGVVLAGVVAWIHRRWGVETAAAAGMVLVFLVVPAAVVGIWSLQSAVTG